MAAAVTYEFYKDTYGGGLGESAFADTLPVAEAHVRWLRAVKGAKTTCNVYRRAVCAVLDAFAEYGASEVGGYTIGEFSVKNYASQQTNGEKLVRLEASYLLSTLKSKKRVAARRDEALSSMPEAQILMSLPGLSAVTCATFLAEVGDVSRFDSAAKLAAYAGLAPRVGQSGRTAHSATKPRGGNRRLKRVLVLSASKSVLFCEEPRTYYDRKRAEGRSYGSAVTALARPEGG